MTGAPPEVALTAANVATVAATVVAPEIAHDTATHVTNTDEDANAPAVANAQPTRLRPLPFKDIRCRVRLRALPIRLRPGRLALLRVLRPFPQGQGHRHRHLLLLRLTTNLSLTHRVMLRLRTLTDKPGANRSLTILIPTDRFPPRDLGVNSTRL